MIDQSAQAGRKGQDSFSLLLQGPAPHLWSFLEFCFFIDAKDLADRQSRTLGSHSRETPNFPHQSDSWASVVP